MTKQEFEERTGLKTDAKEYASIESMYMLAGGMDKDVFCRCWRQTGKNPLTMELAHQAKLLEGHRTKLLSELENEQNKKMEHVRFLLGKAESYSDRDFRNAAIRLIGERRVVQLKLKDGLPLWEEDSQFLLSMMACSDQ